MPRRSAAELAIVPLGHRPARLAPPATLSARERAIFLDLVATMDAKHFRQCDLPLLARYCEAIALAEEAARELRDGGAVLDGKPSPWITVQEKSVRAMVALTLRLRLSPQARPPIGGKRGPAPSVYDRINLERDEPWRA